MQFTVRQAQQSELSSRQLQRLAFLPYRYTAHMIARANATHWAIVSLALAAAAAVLLACQSLALATAALCCVPGYAYLHSRLFDWLVIECRLPEWRDFVAVWSPPHTIYVAECDSTKQLLGLVCLRHESATEGDVQHAAVAPEHRGRGVGASLVGHVISEASRLGYRRLTLYSTTIQQPAVRLYQRMGFTVDRVHDTGVYRRIAFLPKPFAYVHMSMRLLDSGDTRGGDGATDC